MWVIHLLCIATILTFCIDVSGALDHLNRFVWRILYPKVKYNGWEIPLLSCSLCSTWWSGLLYLLITGFTLPKVVVLALIAFNADTIGNLMILSKDLVGKLVDRIYDSIR